MTAIAIPRMQLPELPKIPMPSAKLLDSAATHLGYKYEAPNVRTNAFLVKLDSLGVRPFDPNAVTEYKRRALAEKRGSWFNRTLLNRQLRGLRWRRCGIEEYKEPVPASALELAIKIRRDISPYEFTFRFGIEYLGVVDYHHMAEQERRRHDPFLVVMYESVPYHIAVWDEPTFQG